MQPSLTLFTLLFFLISITTPAVATQPGIVLGHSFHESFEDGFDEPASVTEFAHLEFVPGRARLLAGGLLAYGFLYDPIETPGGGTASPSAGSFALEYWDDLQPGSTMSIVLTAGPDDVFAFSPEITMRVLVHEQQLSIEVDLPDGSHSASIPRTAGWTRISLSDEFTPWGFSWEPVVEREGERISFAALAHALSQWPLHPTRLEIRGEGIELDVLQRHTFTYVANSSVSWGRVKAGY